MARGSVRDGSYAFARRETGGCCAGRLCTEMSMRTATAWLMVGAAVLIGVAGARAMEMADTDWPLDRIVSNLEQRLAAAPDDPQLHYNLGRAHGFAFALERSSLWTMDTRVGPHLKDLEQQRSRLKLATEKDRKWYAPVALDLPPPAPEQLLAHLAQGVQHLRRAVELDARAYHEYLEGQAKSELCLAWLLETGAHLAGRVDT